MGFKPSTHNEDWRLSPLGNETGVEWKGSTPTFRSSWIPTLEGYVFLSVILHTIS